ncbi:MAG: hypothetical protein UH854_00415, partial [Clostridia bacterium]|nr:hypothetical protein [Clostridia bacterium]
DKAIKTGLLISLKGINISFKTKNIIFFTNSIIKHKKATTYLLTVLKYTNAPRTTAKNIKNRISPSLYLRHMKKIKKVVIIQNKISFKTKKNIPENATLPVARNVSNINAVTTPTTKKTKNKNN